MTLQASPPPGGCLLGPRKATHTPTTAPIMTAVTKSIARIVFLFAAIGEHLENGPRDIVTETSRSMTKTDVRPREREQCHSSLAHVLVWPVVHAGNKSNEVLPLTALHMATSASTLVVRSPPCHHIIVKAPPSCYHRKISRTLG